MSGLSSALGVEETKSEEPAVGEFRVGRVIQRNKELPLEIWQEVINFLIQPDVATTEHQKNDLRHLLVLNKYFYSLRSNRLIACMATDRFFKLLQHEYDLFGNISHRFLEARDLQLLDGVQTGSAGSFCSKFSPIFKAAIVSDSSYYNSLSPLDKKMVLSLMRIGRLHEQSLLHHTDSTPLFSYYSGPVPIKRDRYGQPYGSMIGTWPFVSFLLTCLFCNLDIKQIRDLSLVALTVAALVSIICVVMALLDAKSLFNSMRQAEIELGLFGEVEPATAHQLGQLKSLMQGFLKKRGQEKYASYLMTEQPTYHQFIRWLKQMPPLPINLACYQALSVVVLPELSPFSSPQHRMPYYEVSSAWSRGGLLYDRFENVIVKGLSEQIHHLSSMPFNKSRISRSLYIGKYCLQTCGAITFFISLKRLDGLPFPVGPSSLGFSMLLASSIAIGILLRKESRQVQTLSTSRFVQDVLAFKEMSIQPPEEDLVTLMRLTRRFRI